MKKIISVCIGGLILVGALVMMFGAFGVARVAVPEMSVASQSIQQSSSQSRAVTLKVDNMYCASCPYIVSQTEVLPGNRTVT